MVAMARAWEVMVKVTACRQACHMVAMVKVSVDKAMVADKVSMVADKATGHLLMARATATWAATVEEAWHTLDAARRASVAEE